jgi:uncharacterized membrane protein
MELADIPKFGTQEYILWITFIWVALLCLLNFYRRLSGSWLFAGLLFWLIFINRFWKLDAYASKWLIAHKSNWLDYINKFLPKIRIYDNMAIWLMFLVYAALFILLVCIIRQVVYKKVTFMLGFAGFVIYMTAFLWWMYWAFNPAGIEAEIVSRFKEALMGIGNIFFIISFTLSLKR